MSNQTALVAGVARMSAAGVPHKNVFGEVFRCLALLLLACRPLDLRLLQEGSAESRGDSSADIVRQPCQPAHAAAVTRGVPHAPPGRFPASRVAWKLLELFIRQPHIPMTDDMQHVTSPLGGRQPRAPARMIVARCKNKFIYRLERVRALLAGITCE